jgi:hypothetical protein
MSSYEYWKQGIQQPYGVDHIFVSQYNQTSDYLLSQIRVKSGMVFAQEIDQMSRKFLSQVAVTIGHMGNEVDISWQGDDIIIVRCRVLEKQEIYALILLILVCEILLIRDRIAANFIL